MKRTQVNQVKGWLVLLGLSLASSGLAVASDEPAFSSGPGRWQWSQVPISVRASEQGVLAMDFSRELLAVGDEQSLWLVDLRDSDFLTKSMQSTASRRLFGCRDVRDLAFAPDGSLWVASANGLCRLANFAKGPLGSTHSQSLEQATLETLPLGLGDLDLQRLAVTADLLVLGSSTGLLFSHVSSHWRQWQKAPTDLPKGMVTALAVRPLLSTDHGLLSWDVLLGVSGQLWEMKVSWQDSTGFAFSNVRRHSIPDSGLRVASLDLFYDALGTDVLVLEAERIARCQRAMSDGRCSWHSERLRLPPGVHALAAGATEQGLWLATDRGLFLRGQGRERFDHFLEATDHSSIFAVAAHADRAVFVGERGVFLGRRLNEALEAPVASELLMAPRPSSASHEPGIEEVRKAALAYLDLGPEWMRSLREGVVRRGALPVVGLRLGADRSRSRNRDYDESFVSGALHHLNDWDRDRNTDYAVSLSLSWDLADLAYHPESIDVSDEARDVLELRDEVLDELTQLYFDRHRTLLELALLEQGEAAVRPGSSSESDPSEAPLRSVEAVRLRLRADELAAGIDAWTGGWFSERVQPQASSP
jgi:hypothetical protein